MNRTFQQVYKLLMEWVLFCNRDKFDLIAIYDNASETPSLDTICIVCPIAPNTITSPPLPLLRVQPLPQCLATSQYISVFVPHITQSFDPWLLFPTPLDNKVGTLTISRHCQATCHIFDDSFLPHPLEGCTLCICWCPI